MMNHDEFNMLMSDYYDDILDEDLKLEFEQHLKSCDSCKVDYENFKNMLDELNDIDMVELPDEFHLELMDRLKEFDEEQSKAQSNIIEFKNEKYYEDTKSTNNNTNINKLNIRKRFDFKSINKFAFIAASVLIFFGGFLAGDFMPFRANQDMMYEESVSESVMDTSPKMSRNIVQTNMANMDAGVLKANVVEEKKIVKEVYIDLEVENLEDAVRQIKENIESKKGYIENSNMNTKDLYSNIRARVISSNLDEAIKDVESTGIVMNKNISTIDMTKNYTDTKTRLDNLIRQEEKIKSLIERASKIEDLINLEKELNRIVSQKEIYINNMNNIDERVDYSLLNIRVEQKQNTLFKDIGERFKHVLYNTLTNLIKLIEAIPFIAFVYLIYYIFIRKFIKK
ncbi:DUF4349 domain-containing protein [Peptostreptococcaceae bacterium AGR-M142]